MKTKKIIILVEPKTHAALKDAAWRERVSMAEYIRRAIDARLNSVPAERGKKGQVTYEAD